MSADTSLVDDAEVWRKQAQYAYSLIPATPVDYAKSRAANFLEEWNNVMRGLLVSGGFSFSARARHRLDAMAADLADAIKATRDVQFDEDARVSERRLVNSICQQRDDLH